MSLLQLLLRKTQSLRAALRRKNLLNQETIRDYYGKLSRPAILLLVVLLLFANAPTSHVGADPNPAPSPTTTAPTSSPTTTAPEPTATPSLAPKLPRPSLPIRENRRALINGSAAGPRLTANSKTF